MCLNNILKTPPKVGPNGPVDFIALLSYPLIKWFLILILPILHHLLGTGNWANISHALQGHVAIYTVYINSNAA